MSDFDGQVAITLPYTVPSFNEVGYTGGRGSRWKMTNTVKRWKSEVQTLLMAEGLPRGLAFVRVDARVIFATKRRRDPENYRVILSKAVGDALAPPPSREEQRYGIKPLGWLPDDTAEFFRFGEVDLAVEPRSKRTELVFSYRRGRP